MKYCSEASKANHKAEIEVDENAGYYLYIYDAEGKCIADHLQDSLGVAKDQAFEDYGIPMAGWTPRVNEGDVE